MHITEDQIHFLIVTKLIERNIMFWTACREAAEELKYTACTFGEYGAENIDQNYHTKAHFTAPNRPEVTISRYWIKSDPSEPGALFVEIKPIEMTVDQIRELLIEKLSAKMSFIVAVKDLCLDLQATSPHFSSLEDYDRTEATFTVAGKIFCAIRYSDIPWESITGLNVSEVSTNLFSEKVEDDDPIAKSLSKEWINIVSSNDPCVHTWRMGTILSEAYRYRNFLKGVESDVREYELPLPVNVAVGLAEFLKVGWLRNQDVQITENRKKPFRPIKEVHFPVNIIGFKTLCHISITKKKVTLICWDRKNVSVQLHPESTEGLDHEMRIAPFEQFIRMIAILYKHVLPYEE